MVLSFSSARLVSPLSLSDGEAGDVFVCQDRFRKKFQPTKDWIAAAAVALTNRKSNSSQHPQPARVDLDYKEERKKEPTAVSETEDDRTDRSTPPFHDQPPPARQVTRKRHLNCQRAEQETFKEGRKTGSKGNRPKGGPHTQKAQPPTRARIT